MPQNKSAPPPNRTGIVSLIKVLQHFGVKDLQAIYDKNPETDEQLDWDKLKKIAKKHRIRSTLIQPTIDEFRELEYPVIAKMVDGAYIAIGSANDEVILAIDPRENKPKAIPVKEFTESWANELLIFSAVLGAGMNTFHGNIKLRRNFRQKIYPLVQTVYEDSIYIIPVYFQRNSRKSCARSDI